MQAARAESIDGRKSDLDGTGDRTPESRRLYRGRGPRRGRGRRCRKKAPRRRGCPASPSSSSLKRQASREREREREREKMNLTPDAGSLYRFGVIRIPALVFDENSNSPIKGYFIFFIIEEIVCLSK